MTKIYIIELLMLAIILPSECGEVTIEYLEHPSSLNLTCDPYGGTIQLQCLIQEPSSIKIASNLLLLWNWTPVHGKPENNSCQIYPHYQCDQYVGKDKYDFTFKRFTDPNNSSVFLRRVSLVIQNVGIEDEGCYNCHPWHNFIPLPFEQSSDLFCLRSETYYRQFEPCHLKNRTQETTPIAIEPAATSIPKASICSDQLKMLSTMNTTNETNEHSIPYLPITIALCGGLCLLVLIQTAIIIYQCYVKRRKYNCTDNVSHSVEINVKPVPAGCINNENNLCQTGDDAQHFIGTYSYIGPHETKEYLSKTKNEFNENDVKGKNERQITDHHQMNDKAITDGTSSRQVSILSPGVHIYQTLDKYLEQLMNTPPELRNELETEQLQVMNPQSNDQLFDDPNYSPVEISNSINHITLSASCTLPGNYDKLQPKSPDSEYAYAYSHIMKLRKQLKKLKRKDGHTDPSSHFHLELLHVAAMGTYEMDPKLLPQIENTDCHATTRKDSHDIKKGFHDIKKVKPKPKPSRRKTKEETPTTTPHLYETLNKNTMDTNNGYAHLVK